MGLPSRQRGDRAYKSKKSKHRQSRAIVSLVERSGNVRSFHVKQAIKVNVAKIVTDNMDQERKLFIDESRLDKNVGRQFLTHETTKHSAGEYVRGEVHSNTV